MVLEVSEVQFEGSERLAQLEEAVYQAIMSTPDDIEAFYKLREAGEIEEYEVFLGVVRSLAGKGRILKKN